MPRKYPLQNDLTGQQFGRLTVVQPVEYVIHWECRCRCGVLTYSTARDLKSGKRVSCGCKNIDRLRATMTKHGLGRSASRKQHTNMSQRCYNPNTTQFHRYGGRGIGVCQGWKDFLTWYQDFGHSRPTKKHSIDRINNDGGYWCGYCDECKANDWPMNCSWELHEKQMNHRAVTKFLTFKDQTLSLGEWSQMTGLDTSTLWGRIKDGWPAEDILTLPVFPKNKFRTDLIKPDALQNKDLTNQRFGHLVALSPERRTKTVLWHCVCNCGSKTIVRALRLIKGETKACRRTACRKRDSRPTIPPTTEVQRTTNPQP